MTINIIIVILFLAILLTLVFHTIAILSNNTSAGQTNNVIYKLANFIRYKLFKEDVFFSSYNSLCSNISKYRYDVEKKYHFGSNKRNALFRLILNIFFDEVTNMVKEIKKSHVLFLDKYMLKEVIISGYKSIFNNAICKIQRLVNYNELFDYLFINEERSLKHKYSTSIELVYALLEKTLIKYVEDPSKTQVDMIKETFDILNISIGVIMSDIEMELISYNGNLDNLLEKIDKINAV